MTSLEITAEDIDVQVESIRMLGARVQNRVRQRADGQVDEGVLGRLVVGSAATIVYYSAGAPHPLNHAVLAFMLGVIMRNDPTNGPDWRIEQRGEVTCRVLDVRVRHIYDSVIIGGRIGPPHRPPG